MGGWLVYEDSFYAAWYWFAEDMHGEKGVCEMH